MIVVIGAVVLLLAAFSATGLFIAVREVARLRGAAHPQPPDTLAGRFDRYVGPIDTRHAALNAPLRVLAEFLSALCGFPGLGWMASGRIRIGLPLIVVVPALVWAFFPLYVSTLGVVYARPLTVFAALPAMALLSAGWLLAVELKGGS